jgi:hypothetical protein
MSAPRWTDADVARWNALGVTIWRLTKPEATVNLYGIKQRLQFMHPTKEARASMESDGVADRIGRPLTLDQARFLERVIARVLDGERDARVAFELPIDGKPSSVRPQCFAAEYALATRLWPDEKPDALRTMIAEAWGVTPARVSQARGQKEHGPEIDAWINGLLALAARHQIPEALALDRALQGVVGMRRWFMDHAGEKIDALPPETAFRIEFPCPLPLGK